MLGPEYHAKLTFVKDGATPESKQKFDKHLVQKALSKLEFVGILSTFSEKIRFFENEQINKFFDQMFEPFSRHFLTR